MPKMKFLLGCPKWFFNDIVYYKTSVNYNEFLREKSSIKDRILK